MISSVAGFVFKNMEIIFLSRRMEFLVHPPSSSEHSDSESDPEEDSRSDAVSMFPAPLKTSSLPELCWFCEVRLLLLFEEDVVAVGSWRSNPSSIIS